MDALALLCNLHGDGPVTLAALRDVGCEDLLGLEALGEQLLAELLDRDERGVARFRREARLLYERLEGEREQADSVAVIAPQPPPSVEPLADIEAPPAPPAGVGPGPVVSAVLDIWKQLDEGLAEPPASNVLKESQLNGLKPGQALALERAGVRTIEELAEADLLSLARQTELAYTHLAHLAFLARKLCAHTIPTPSAPAPLSVVQDLGSERGSFEEGSAGPFA